MALTAEQVKNNLINQILYNFPTAETNTGSVLRDIFVDPQSVQISNLSEEIDDVKNLSTFVKNAEYISEEDLDAIGENYGVTRDLGQFANGIITFQTTVRPSQRIQIGNDEGSGGISVKTLQTENGNSLEFVTTQTVYMDTDATYNEQHNCYEVSAPITAQSSGSEYNVGVGTITVLVSGIAGITSVYNYTPTTNGTDKQGQTSFAQTIQNTILGSSKDIESGINSILLNIDGVQEVKTLHPNSDEEHTDTGYAVSYVKGKVENIKDDFVFTYSGTEFSFNFPKKPVTRIISVKAIVDGKETILEQGIDYTLKRDSNNIYYDTIYGIDKIELLVGNGKTPDTNTNVVVSFAYNSLIETCQETLNKQLTDYLVLGELLVAQAEPVIIDISTAIKLKYNYNTEAIKNQILTGLSNYITSLKLGADITQEDIYTFLSTTYSDYITGIVFPFLTFKKRNDVLSSNELYFTFGEYASVDENSLNISFE